MLLEADMMTEEEVIARYRQREEEYRRRVLADLVAE